MATFTASTEWQPIEIGGEEIQKGSFIVWAKSPHRIGFIRSTLLPTAANGDVWVDETKENLQFSLHQDDRLYCKTDVGTADFTIEDRR